MGGYQSNYDDSFDPDDGAVDDSVTGSVHGKAIGQLGAVLSVKATEKATINGQAAWEEEGTYAFALNVAYELVPGFTITPEINYTKFDGARRPHPNSTVAATTHSAVSSASSATSNPSRIG